LDTGAVSRLNDVGLDNEVLVKKISRIGIVGEDTADLAATMMITPGCTS
jgi:hypothetical protein